MNSVKGNKHAGVGPRDAGAVFQPHPDVVSQRLGDEVLLINLQTNRMFELNRTGARLWELLSAGIDRAQIEQRMLEEFEVSESELSAEIEQTLSLLRDENLVEYS